MIGDPRGRLEHMCLLYVCRRSDAPQIGSKLALCRFVKRLVGLGTPPLKSAERGSDWPTEA